MGSTVHRAHAIGSWTLVALGVGHGAGTLVDVVRPTFFCPVDPHVLAAMQSTTVRLGAMLAGERMTMWRGHIGWNLSIALGFAFTGLTQILLGRLDPQLGIARRLLPLTVLVSVLWTAIAASFWFWVPCTGFAIASASLAFVLYGLRAAPAPEPRPRTQLWWLGALPIGVAGFLHGAAFLPDLSSNALFSPSAPEVRAAMERTDLAVPSMVGVSRSIWTAYAGFHLAHGVAAASFGVTALVLARHLPDGPQARAVLTLFAAASFAWMAIAAAFWFWAPLAATGLAAMTHARLLALSRRDRPAPL